MTRPFISKTEKTSLEKKLVGVYISREDANRLALLSLINNVSRSKILLSIIDKYLSKRMDLDTLIKKTVNTAWKNWEDKKNLLDIKKSILDKIFDEFCRDTKTDLKTQRIDPQIINSIISELKACYEKNKES